ncbi:MAG: glycosyltransferase family 39 protein [Bryobacteraceae bacterium]
MVKARYKPFWLDEIITLSIAKLPRISDIWALCRSGAEYQPPLYHYLMRASIRLFGSDELGIRLPSIAGYVLFCLCLYWFVARCTSRLYGLIAMLFPCLTRCWYYATEGRSYALVLACSGIAAVCWQSIAMNRRRTWMLFGLGVSSACAIGLHYYSVLLFVPLASAELVRSYQRRKIDVTVWLALAVPFATLIPYLPLIRENRLRAGILYVPFARPAWYGSLDLFASQFLRSSLVALVAIGCVYLIFEIFGQASEPEREKRESPMRTTFLPVAILVLGFTCLPIFGIALSKFVTHLFFDRYVMAAVFGISALLALGLWRAYSGRKEPALAVLLILVGVIAHAGVWDLKEAKAQRSNPPRAALQDKIPAAAFPRQPAYRGGGPRRVHDVQLLRRSSVAPTRLVRVE